MWVVKPFPLDTLKFAVYPIAIIFIKGVSTRQRRGPGGEGMQLSYILYRGRNAGGY